MNVGQLSIFIAFFSALGSTVAFYRLGSRSSGNRKDKPGSADAVPYRLYWAMTIAGFVATAVLLYGLLGHQFQYSYIARYSSRSLPLMYLVSALWAGQEGTFLLWAVLVSVMGLMFAKRLRDDSHAMAVVSAFSAFLYLLLILKSPFEFLTPVPADGSGLNPLLQDPWMAIHPPILFIGYAATVFPFALVVSGLIRRNYARWFASGFSWTLFASLALGAGIIIGGFWAYEVLGWGGYWGWDPVENSSLVPWLVLLALVHGLLIQRNKGALVRTNMVLAILSFVLVLYATFLTRSGVLADFSVHSFVDLGIANYLIGSILLSGVVGFGLFASRFRELRAAKIDSSGLNREVILSLSLFALLAAALFTFAGMSSPIITGVLGKASQVDTSFYDKVNLPVGIVIGLLLGLGPFLGWSGEVKSGLLKRVSLSVVLSGLGIVIAFVAGVRSVLVMAFVGSSVFGLISNVIIAFRQYRSGWETLGGPLGHIGAALLLLGIIGSGSFDEREQIVLRPGEPQHAQGYTLTFRGASESPNGKTQMNIEVSDGRTSYMATPKLYFSEYNKSMLREPDIRIFPLKDLYLSPLELRTSEAAPAGISLEITKGETKSLGAYEIEFAGFETGEHGEPGQMKVGALLNVSVHGTKHVVTPRIVVDANGQQTRVPADLPASQFPTKGTTGPQVQLMAMNVEQKKILLGFSGFEEHGGTGSAQELIVEVSTKPLMMVVWTGVVLIIAGTAIGFRRRVVENAK